MLLANKSSDFWKEIRKVKGSSDTLPSVIDNMSNDEDIYDLFAKKYDQLYNSVSFDQNNMSILKDKIDELIDETPNAYPHVSVDDVVRGILLKRNGMKKIARVSYIQTILSTRICSCMFSYQCCLAL